MVLLDEGLMIADINVQVVRKDIKNINFSVSAPDGHVRVSAPKYISDEVLRSAVLSRLGWIRKKIQTIKNLPTRPVKKYVSGEEHYYLGELYKLVIFEQICKPHISLPTSTTLQMFVCPNASLATREKLLYEWYRTELKKRIPPLIEKWQPIIGKKVSDWGVKRMKTRWGTCNINKKRIWLNLELIKRSEASLEYVVVHEMTHLLERNHNARFKTLLDGFIPGWREIERELKSNSYIIDI